MGGRVCIAGGGMSGLAIAQHLRERSDVDVVIIEAGEADLSALHVREQYSPMAAERRCMDRADDPFAWRPWSTTDPRHYGADSVLRRRLGGRSLYWAGVSVPIEPWALLDWPENVRRDLAESWDGGPSLYERTSVSLATWTGAAPPSDALTLGQVRFTPVPCAARPLAAGRWTAYTPLPAVADDPRVCVVGGAEVLRLEVRGSGSVRVHTRGRDGLEDFHDCDVACLAAGTLENSRLAADLLGADELPGLNDHLVQGVVIPLRDTLPISASAGVLYWSPGDSEQRWNTFVRVRADPGHVPLLHVWTMGEQLRSDASVVRVTPAGVEVAPGLCEQDVKLLDAERRYLTELAREVDADLDEVDFGDFLAAERPVSSAMAAARAGVATALSWPLGTVDHEAGTLPLGSVLTDDGEVGEATSVFAAGPATFPRSGAANPSLTTLALAQRTARVIAQRIG